MHHYFHCLHMFEDHVLHFYISAGPDFIVGPDAPKQDRNILGVVNLRKLFDDGGRKWLKYWIVRG